jgi:hypothetical protein
MAYIIIGIIFIILGISERIFFGHGGFSGVYMIIGGGFFIILGYDKIKKRKKISGNE